jgi:hypothetical protein
MSKLIASTCILAALFMAGVLAQTTPTAITQIITVIPQPVPTVIVGADLGFRVEGHRGTTPVGRLVVRIDGQWIEVEDAIVAKKITTR